MDDAFKTAARRAIAGAIAQLQREAEQAEALQLAEHRAFIAESRMQQAEVMARLEARVSELVERSANGA